MIHKLSIRNDNDNINISDISQYLEWDVKLYYTIPYYITIFSISTHLQRILCVGLWLLCERSSIVIGIVHRDLDRLWRRSQWLGL